MKVRCDVFLGEDSRLDLSFLKGRKTWLYGTGIYLEFILRGMYDRKINFNVTGDKEAILISRYSWNRFFINLQESGTVSFTVTLEDSVIIKEVISFNVMKIEEPLVISVPDLLTYPVSDIRYFANRLSESMINMTRCTLFTFTFMERLYRVGASSKDFFNYYEMLFSILTERGVSLIISPYGDMAYMIDFIKNMGKDVLWSFVRLGQKYRVIWDFTLGLRQKELGGLLDSVWNRYKEAALYAVYPDMVEKVGGEGFAYVLEDIKLDEVPILNERGIKIARLIDSETNFQVISSFTKRMVEKNWGVELRCNVPSRQLRKVEFFLGQALFQGYRDAKGI